MKNKNYQLALELRRNGKSYAEIEKQLHVSKSTLSNWFSKEEWSQNIVTVLNSQRKIDVREKVLLMNTARKKNLESKYRLIKEQAIKEFELLKTNPLFLIGLSLYWGEGDKVYNGRVALINSDPALLKVIRKFYVEVLNIDCDKLRVGMFIYPDHSEKQLKDYWSKELEIPSNQFIKTQILESKAKLTKRKTLYGVCSLYFSSTEVSIRIHEWIKLLSTEIYMRE